MGTQVTGSVSCHIKATYMSCHVTVKEVTDTAAITDTKCPVWRLIDSLKRNEVAFSWFNMVPGTWGGGSSAEQ